MGYETRCRVTVIDLGGGERSADATVLLETDELIVRGEARVKVPRSSITNVRKRGSTVTIDHTGGRVLMEVGADEASKWIVRLQAPPKPLIDKLDVKPDAKVWVSGVEDAQFLQSLRERTPNVQTGRTASSCDVVFLAVERMPDLARIEKAAAAMTESGALWVVHPKGRNGIADTAVFAAAKDAGLTYTKVARFSDTHTAEKLVRPRVSRS